MEELLQEVKEAFSTLSAEEKDIVRQEFEDLFSEMNEDESQMTFDYDETEDYR